MEQLEFLIQTYPWVKHLISIMIICRVAFKPIFSILGRYVELTIDQDDNKKLHKFMGTKTYKMIVFIVDLVASAKLPTIKTVEKKQ